MQDRLATKSKEKEVTSALYMNERDSLACIGGKGLGQLGFVAATNAGSDRKAWSDRIGDAGGSLGKAGRRGGREGVRERAMCVPSKGVLCCSHRQWWKIERDFAAHGSVLGQGSH